jgi:penicillin-binding protein 1A
MNFYPIDRKTGLSAQPGAPGTILEAFKPGTAPPDTYSIIGASSDSTGAGVGFDPQSGGDGAAVSSGGTGGLY